MPGPAQPAVDLRLLEQMSRGLPDAGGFHTPEGVAVVEEMAERAGAVVLGPGLGRDEGALEFARGVASRVRAPLLVDADGLNAHAGRLELFGERNGAHRAHAARGRARPAAGARLGRRDALAAGLRARGGASAAARWCCSRATTRSWRCPTASWR